MAKYYTLEYWLDEDMYVGRLKEVPGVFSQGKTLEELKVKGKKNFFCQGGLSENFLCN